MRSFLLKNNRPINSWGMLEEGTLFRGDIPEGFDLAVNPHYPYIIVDVDRHGKIDGFDSIPKHLKQELDNTLNYPTKHNGKHYWFYYTGDVNLPNKASGVGIDLRVWSSKKNNGGYVKWHPRNTMKIEDVLYKAQPSSNNMNNWLDSLFSYKHSKVPVISTLL